MIEKYRKIYIILLYKCFFMIKIKKFINNLSQKIKKLHIKCILCSTVDVMDDTPRVMHNNYINNNQNNINNEENEEEYNYKNIDLYKLENHFGNYINNYYKINNYTNKVVDKNTYISKLDNTTNYNLYINKIEKECSICISKINPLYHNILKLECSCNNIYYHKECINQWLLTYPTCPICKEYININIPNSFIKKDYFIIIMLNLILSSYSFEDIYNYYCYNYKKKDLFYIYKILYNYLLSKKYKNDIKKNNINIKFNYKLV